MEADDQLLLFIQQPAFPILLGVTINKGPVFLGDGAMVAHKPRCTYLLLVSRLDVNINVVISQRFQQILVWI